MKKLIFIVSLVLAGFILLSVFSSQPKYTYAVREKVNPSNNKVEWDLWCWHEYSNGKIKKSFIGHFSEVGSNYIPDRVETNLCV